MLYKTWRCQITTVSWGITGIQIIQYKWLNYDQKESVLHSKDLMSPSSRGAIVPRPDSLRVLSLSDIVHNGTTTMGRNKGVSVSAVQSVFSHKIELWAQWTCRNIEYREHVHASVALHGLQRTMTYTMTHMKAVDYSHSMLFWLCPCCKAAITTQLAPKLNWEHLPFTFLRASMCSCMND